MFTIVIGGFAIAEELEGWKSKDVKLLRKFKLLGSVHSG